MLDVLPRTKLETGRLVSPDGVPFVGFKITITDAGGAPMDTINFDDIDAMVRSHPDEIYTKESYTEDGKFKSISGSTEPF